MKLTKDIIEKIRALKRDYECALGPNHRRDIYSFYTGFLTALESVGIIDTRELLQLVDILLYPEKAEELEELNE